MICVIKESNEMTIPVHNSSVSNSCLIVTCHDIIAFHRAVSSLVLSHFVMFIYLVLAYFDRAACTILYLQQIHRHYHSIRIVPKTET